MREKIIQIAVCEEGLWALTNSGSIFRLIYPHRGPPERMLNWEEIEVPSLLADRIEED